MAGGERIEIEGLLAKSLQKPCFMFPALREKLDAPNEKGVYINYSPDDEVLHVGRTPSAKGGLGQRLRNHLAGSSSFARIYLKRNGARLRDGYKFRCLVIKNSRHRALVEALGIVQLCLAHIGIAEKSDKLLS